MGEAVFLEYHKCCPRLVSLTSVTWWSQELQYYLSFIQLVGKGCNTEKRITTSYLKKKIECARMLELRSNAKITLSTFPYAEKLGDLPEADGWQQS